MFWTCPMCGYENDRGNVNCMCGFVADESVLKLSEELKSYDTSAFSEKNLDVSSDINEIEMPVTETKPKKIKDKAKEKPLEKKSTAPEDEILLKEIDSWKFTFSNADQCIYLGTPALQSFRIKLTISDLQELLEFMFEKSGIEKTTRKLELSKEEILELISIMGAKIEEKKSKIKLDYSSEELHEIADLINKKLND